MLASEGITCAISPNTPTRPCRPTSSRCAGRSPGSAPSPAAPRRAARAPGRPICTCRLVLVKVPHFSACAEAGRITSACQAVSVRKMSCTTRCSSLASASRACCTSGSDIAGFSPSMYMPLISPSWMACMISTTVSPRLGGSVVPQNSSYMLRMVGILDRLVVGEEHRDQARVRGALHVVLPAQRMQARARPADLAGDERQRDQAARVVGAVRVLGDAHAPEDDRALGAGVEARHLADGGGGDAAHRLHLLRREVLHLRLQALEALGVRLHVLDVDHALRDDDVEHGVEQGDVAARLELQDVAGVARQPWACPRGSMTISLAPRLAAFLRKVAATGMVLGRPRADDDDAVAVLGAP